MTTKCKRDDSKKYTRKSYTAERKLEIVAYAKEHGNRAASRQYAVGESSVREWRIAKDKLKNLEPRQRARRGKTAKWPILENNLAIWIRAQRDNGRAASTLIIRMKEQTIAAEMNLMDFKGNSGWDFKFMKRNQLSVRV